MFRALETLAANCAYEIISGGVSLQVSHEAVFRCVHLATYVAYVENRFKVRGDVFHEKVTLAVLSQTYWATEALFLMYVQVFLAGC